MKRIILLLFALVPSLLLAQTSVQKGAGNVISNGPIVVGNANSITPSGTGVIRATEIPTISILPTAPLTGGGALTGNVTIGITQSNGATNGFLSSTDWTTFNTKQPAGNYITALTGDGTASGPGNVAFTLSTVLATPGSVGTATAAPVITFDAKGRATTTGAVTITPALGSITGLGTGVATFLSTPSSANLAGVVTDETGTGSLVFAASPNLTTPHFGQIVNTGTVTLPTSTDTLVGRATTDTLTNKSMSGATNTFTSIPNSALSNNSVTVGSTTIALGGTSTTLAGLNSIAAASTTDLVLNGGSSGASLTLGQGANGSLAANLGLVPLIKVNNSTNNYTVALGYGASASNTTANYNTAVGYNALTAATTGGENTAVGAVALSRTTTGVQNVAVGSDALAFNTTGNYNTAVGWSALLNNTAGTDNAAGGLTALQANTSGSFNTAWGDAALVGNTTGGHNSALGYSAGGGVTTGTYNTFLGAGSSVSSGTFTKAIAIGANAVAGASNVAVIGGAFGTADAVNVGVGTLTPVYPLSVVGNGYVSGSMAIGATAPTSAKLSVVGGNIALDDAAKLYWAGTTNAYIGISSNVMTLQAFSSVQINTWNGAAYVPGLTISSNSLATTLAGNLTVSGTGTSSFAGALLSSNATAGFGYTTGAGGAVIQATSRTTGVTLNKVCGTITLFNAAGSASWQTFTFTNSAIAVNDVVHVTQQSGTDAYQIFVTNTAAGSCKITFATTGGTTTESPVFNYVVVKGSAN